MDAQFNMHSEADSEGGDYDEEDYSNIDPSNYDDYLDKPPEEKREAMIREMWRIERRENVGRNGGSDPEEDEADFQQWIEEQNSLEVDYEDNFYD